MINELRQHEEIVLEEVTYLEMKFNASHSLTNQCVAVSLHKSIIHLIVRIITPALGKHKPTQVPLERAK